MTFCNYCNQPARLVLGRELYPHRPDLADLKAWKCDRCNASVGCHEGTTNPKGTLATPGLRALRMACHRLFDPIWQDYLSAYPEQIKPSGKLRRIARMRAYEWLSTQMGQTEQVHIGQSDEAACEQIMGILRQQKPTATTIREWAKARRGTK